MDPNPSWSLTKAAKRKDSSRGTFHHFLGRLFNPWGSSGRTTTARVVGNTPPAGVGVEEDIEGVPFRRLTYAELEKATGGFSPKNRLGATTGEKGTVYRGSLQFKSGKATHVAVKVFHASCWVDHGRDYSEEIGVIARLRHRNIVPLLGWCHEKDHFVLVYKYMPRGSLKDLLSRDSTSKGPVLPWDVRYKVAAGLAKALQYLQEERKEKELMVHRDIKPSNILLDDKFEAGLTDFEIARVATDSNTVATTLAMSHYTAPEHYSMSMTGRELGKEMDIYSFGVVALELACGYRGEDVSLVHLVREKKQGGATALLEMADRKLGNDFDRQQMQRLLLVGLVCTDLSPKQRPPIARVIGMLAGTEGRIPEGNSNSSPVFVPNAPAMPPIEEDAENECGFDIETVLVKDGFDIGIPHDLVPAAVGVRESDRPIVSGVVASLRDRLMSGEPPRFEEVLESIRRDTRIFVMVGAPLGQWNVAAQRILRAFKTLEGFGAVLRREGADAEAVKRVDERWAESSRAMREEEARVEKLKRQLASAEETRDSLAAQVERMKREIEETERKRLSLEQEVVAAEKNSAERRVAREEEERLHATVKLSELVFTAISSVSSGK